MGRCIRDEAGYTCAGGESRGVDKAAHLADFRKEGADLLAIHVECPREGTRILARKMKFDFPLANDDQAERR